MNQSLETKREFTVSVIIPAYNSSRYLVEAIDSVLRQTRPAYEIIVVDDGSTDNTKVALGPFIEQKQIKYVGQRNAGPAAARNRGIELAAGDLIAFLDADDIWLPNKLERQLPLFLDENVGLVYGPRIEFSDGREKTVNLPRPTGNIFPLLIKSNFITNSSVIIRRSVLAETGNFDEDRHWQAIEDYELWLRIAARFKISCVAEPVVKYRLHSNQISHEINNKSLILKRDICRKLWQDKGGQKQRIAIAIEYLRNSLRLMKSVIITR